MNNSPSVSLALRDECPFTPGIFRENNASNRKITRSAIAGGYVIFAPVARTTPAYWKLDGMPRLPTPRGRPPVDFALPAKRVRRSEVGREVQSQREQALLQIFKMGLALLISVKTDVIYFLHGYSDRCASNRRPS